MEVTIDGKRFVRDGDERHVERCDRCSDIDYFKSEVQRLIGIRKSYLDRDSDVSILSIQSSMAIEVLREVLDLANELWE